jgi:hypothetical protein
MGTSSLEVRNKRFVNSNLSRVQESKLIPASWPQNIITIFLSITIIFDFLELNFRLHLLANLAIIFEEFAVPVPISPLRQYRLQRGDSL